MAPENGRLRKSSSLSSFHEFFFYYRRRRVFWSTSRARASKNYFCCLVWTFKYFFFSFLIPFRDYLFPLGFYHRAGIRGFFRASMLLCWNFGFLAFFIHFDHKKGRLKNSILMAAPTAQNGPRLKIHVGNVSQDRGLYHVNYLSWWNFEFLLQSCILVFE